MMHVPRCTLLFCLMILAACDSKPDESSSNVSLSSPALAARVDRLDTEQVTERTIALLSDTGVLLAKPTHAAEDAQGNFIFTDVSDKQIRRFRADGSSDRVIGRPGAGPGEFTSLVTAQPLGDSLVIAYDFAVKRITLFNDSGGVVHEFTPSPTPFDIRVLDDQALLFLGHPSAGGKLLRIADLEGRRVADFLEQKNFAQDQRIKFLTVVFADGRAGVIYAALFGGDSLFAFNYAGERLGAIQLQYNGQPLPTIDKLFADAGKVTQKADGRWFHDGMPAVMRVVALPGGRCAIQIARYDTKSGTDVLEGGEIQLFGVSKQEGIQQLLTRPVSAGLLGRSQNGAPIFLGYADTAAHAYRLTRWVMP